MISNDGFSVVAPISRIVPRSTYGRNASCCALLKRWISSTNRIVRECISAACPAAAITCLISLIPLMTAENSMKLALVVSAMILASVVLPTPGGPQRIMEPVLAEPNVAESLPSRSICTRSGLPGPNRCSCPL